MEKHILKEYIHKLYTEVSVATIASSKGNKPWVANVFFVSDKDLNLYFLTSTKSIHTSNFLINPQVSISIFDNSSNYNLVHGVQIDGIVKSANLSEISKGLKLYLTKFPEAITKAINPRILLSSLSTSKMYLVIPQYIKYTNSNLKNTEGTSCFEYSLSYSKSSRKAGNLR
jgi:uncharacterized protein YhbP (UPF0306 family)